ncbi:hypothetical protein MRX96_007458 [Rhipicephalus microplus]
MFIIRGAHSDVWLPGMRGNDEGERTPRPTGKTSAWRARSYSRYETLDQVINSSLLALTMESAGGRHRGAIVALVHAEEAARNAGSARACASTTRRKGHPARDS